MGNKGVTLLISFNIDIGLPHILDIKFLQQLPDSNKSVEIFRDFIQNFFVEGCHIPHSN